MRWPARYLVPPLLALFVAALPLSAGRQAPGAPGQPVPPAAARNVRFGLPGPATADPKDRERYLIARPQYVLSYHADKKIPNWVCWNLLADDIGAAVRAPFEQDPGLPAGFSRVVSKVYTGGGFDRGHMCPAKDRSATPADSRAVFFMTNIVPQSPNSNQRGWERLEDYCRRLAKEGKSLYLACGPAGVGKNGPADEIGKGRLKVTVPHKLWKVVLVLPRADADRLSLRFVHDVL
jgi:endonuclease G